MAARDDGPAAASGQRHAAPFGTPFP
jgi:hypothetical protein